MFPVAKEMVLGYATRKALNAYHDVKGALELAKNVVNTPEVLARCAALWPSATALMRDTKFRVFVSLADDLAAAGQPVPVTGFYCGMAELRDYGRGGQIHITVSTDIEEDKILDIIIHEARHLEDLASGRLVSDVVRGEITWEGVVYKAHPVDAVVGKANESSADTAARYVAAAQYFAQPWEARANEGLWGIEFPGVVELVEEFGTTWPVGLDAGVVLEALSKQSKPNVYLAVKEVLSR